MKDLRLYLLIVLAVIVGEIALILLSSLVQEVIFDGIFWTSSSQQDLVLGGFLTFLSAVIPGFLAMWIMKNQSFAPHVFLSLLIAVETTWLIASNQTPDPVWFDSLAGSSLVIGVFLGGWLKRRVRHSPLLKSSATHPS